MLRLHIMGLPRVHLVGGDFAGWALDMDLRLTKEALTGIVEFVETPEQADFLHTVCVEQLVYEPKVRAKMIPGKTIVAHFTIQPRALFEQFPTLYAECRNWVCIAQTREAADELHALRMPVVKAIPYVGELEKFFPVPQKSPELSTLREELNLPRDKYIIGLFQRDTLGADLTQFKPQKGPDVFLAILVGLKKRVGADRFHVLLAGPRRHWIRKQLEAHGISYTFDGEITPKDDYPKNIVSLERLNLLTNLIDLYVIPSRWEGAPQAAFETVAARRKILSSAIAVPKETLDPRSLFSNVSAAIERIASDIEQNTLEPTLNENHRRIFEKHSVARVREAWRGIYGELEGMRHHAGTQAAPTPAIASAPIHLRYRLLAKPLAVVSRFRQRWAPQKSITFWGEMVDGPYGGGSQVFKALAGELRNRGYRIHNNTLNDSHGHILNSTFFDIEKCRSVVLSSKHRPKVIHRIDGPINLYRGKDRELDDAIFRLNRELATTTAFQCFYSWRESLQLGYDPVQPMIIRNACDPAFFHRAPNSPLGPKIRLISTSWSTNLKKGFDVYKTLDETLDFERFDYTFVGRTPYPFKNIRLVDAVPSRELGEHLRSADIFITASLHDPASNSLLEAMNCGLPVIYANSGGHSEIAGFGGLPFDRVEEIPSKLEAIIRDYESYRMLTYTRSLKEIVDQYLEVLDL